MPDLVDLETARFAALAAPAIDRAFISAIASPRYRGGRELVQRYGGSDAVGPMIDLRNVLAAGRSVGREIVHVSPYRYRDPDAIVTSLERTAEAELLEPTADGRYVASQKGRSFLGELTSQHATALGERWANHSDRVERLTALIGRVLTAADGTGGPGWATFSPVHEPDGTPAPVVLLNRLQLLRHHRADAHAAGWQAAGLVAHEIVTLPSGAVRDAIEDDTNVRAAPPYTALSADERLTLLADLAALP